MTDEDSFPPARLRFEGHGYVYDPDEGSARRGVEVARHSLVRDLCSYVRQAAGDESVLLPVSALRLLMPIAEHREILMRAVMNVARLDMLRRCHEDRTALKDEVRRLRGERDEERR